MNSIQLINLTLGLVPVALTLGIMVYWSLSVRAAIIAVFRMLIQLLLIGYALNFIFGINSSWPVLLILCLMLLAASWISLGSLNLNGNQLFMLSLLAISMSGLFTLLITTQGILNTSPWYSPQVIIPIAGMIFSNSMNTISLAAERFLSEFERSEDYIRSRNIAFQTAMIPITNSLLAVGLVSLPGMMTGQILSGVSPLIAVRYQIMVMLMIFGSAGLSAAIFLSLIRKIALPKKP
ncbi:MAG: ABC transporter permease [Gammaproteobacteria bacterium]|nr:ABC transporter permease [Gammaproteobacteria bacterium]MBL7000995.1 ABC transporter permease [Gammaproteobacteria bacterium]